MAPPAVGARGSKGGRSRGGRGGHGAKPLEPSTLSTLTGLSRQANGQANPPTKLQFEHRHHANGYESFSERITFAGRANDFVVARDTWVAARLYANWPSEVLVEGAIISGTRIENVDGTKCKWRASKVASIDRPAVNGIQARSLDGSIPFAERVTYAGRAAQFVIVGGDTYVGAQLLAPWSTVHAGDRLRGTRVRNESVRNGGGGSSKWRATSVCHVERDQVPPPKQHEALLDSAEALLSSIERRRAGRSAALGGAVGSDMFDDTGGTAGGADASAASSAVGSDALACSDVRPGGGAMASASVIEGQRLLDLAEQELTQHLGAREALTQASGDEHPSARMHRLLAEQRQAKALARQACHHEQPPSVTLPAKPRKPRHRDTAAQAAACANGPAESRDAACDANSDCLGGAVEHTHGADEAAYMY